MLRLPCKDSWEPFSALTFPHFATSFIAISVTLVLIGSLSGLPTAPSDQSPSKEQTALPRLVDWVRKTGKSTVIRANVAEQFGLPPEDLPVLQRGFRKEGEQFTHVCSVGVLPSRSDLLFLASVDENDGRAVVWRARPDGVLLATVEFVGGVAREVSNAKFETGFSMELTFFLSQSLRPSTSGAPPPSPASHSDEDSR